MHSYGSVSLHNEGHVILPSQSMSQFFLFVSIPTTTFSNCLKNVKVEF